MNMNWELLNQLNIYSVTLRLLMALVFGGIVGLERGSRRRAAGFRTYMLVCIGSALVMITNQYIAETFGTGDPSRLGAQVISGIGFLGAGTIIVTRNNHVIGLTTAAGLWASACLGLTIGIGFYSGAIVGSIFIFIVIAAMQKVDNRMISRARTMELYVELAEGGKLSDVLGFAHSNSIRVLHVEFTDPKFQREGLFATLISLRLPKRHPHDEVIEEFYKIEGVHYIEEM